MNSILAAPTWLGPCATPGAGLQTDAAHPCRLMARHGGRHLASQDACLFSSSVGKSSVICGAMGGADHSYADKIQETKRSILFFELEHHPPPSPRRK